MASKRCAMGRGGYATVSTRRIARRDTRRAPVLDAGARTALPATSRTRAQAVRCSSPSNPYARPEPDFKTPSTARALVYSHLNFLNSMGKNAETADFYRLGFRRGFGSGRARAAMVRAFLGAFFSFSDLNIFQGVFRSKRPRSTAGADGRAANL